MHIKIDHKEQSKGIFKSKTYHTVSLSVTMSEEEIEIINKRGLFDYVVWERDLDARSDHVTNPEQRKAVGDIAFLKVRALMTPTPDVYYCRTPSDAKAYEAELVEHLKQMKNFLTENADVAEKTKSFEL